MFELCVLSGIWLVISVWMVHRGTPNDLVPEPERLEPDPGKTRVWRPEGPEAVQRVRKRVVRETVILPLSRRSVIKLVDLDSGLTSSLAAFRSRRERQGSERFDGREAHPV